MRPGLLVWDVHAQALLDAVPHLPAPKVNPHADDPALTNELIEWLCRTKVVDEWSAELCERRLAALREVRMERFCGYFMPRCSREQFEMAVRWTAILWLVDDTMDKVTTADKLQRALAINRRFLLAALSGRRLSDAPPLVDLILDYLAPLQRLMDPELFERFLRAARAWLQLGAFALAERRLQGLGTSVGLHIQLRRWDGAVDTCAVHLACGCSPAPRPWLELPVVRRLQQIAATHVAVMNDIVSYEQEVIYPGRHFGFVADTNLVWTFAQGGAGGLSRAVQRVLDYLVRLSREFERLRVELNRASPEAAGVSCYVAGLGEMMRGNVLWSLESGRYRSATSQLPFLHGPRHNQFEALLQYDDSSE